MPTKLTPFPFQRQMVDAFHGFVESCQDILMCAGTGAGKTFMSAMIIEERLKANPEGRVLFLVDLNALIPQAIEEFRKLGVTCVPYQGSKSLSQSVQFQVRKAQVVVASCQTLHSRMKKHDLNELIGDGINLVIADEAHTTAFSSAYTWIHAYYPSSVTFLGLSATVKTETQGDRYLGRLFQKVIVSPSMPEMVKMGRCVPFRLLSPSGVLDVSRLHIDEYTGDFDLEEQGEQLETRYPQIVEAWKRYAENRSTVFYCPTLPSADSLKKEFLRRGIVAETQDGSTPMGLDGLSDHANDRHTRAAINFRLDTGATKVVISVGTQVKGWNLPSLGCIGIVRATSVLSLFLQIVGRGGRTCSNPYWNNGRPKEDCIFMDFGGNLERFAPISPNSYGVKQSDYDISMIPVTEFYREKTKGEATVEPPKEEEPEPEQLDPSPEPLELYEWFDSHALNQIKFLRNLKKQAYERNYHPEEPNRVFLKQYGFLPPVEWHVGAVFGAFPTESDRRAYAQYLTRYAPHDFWLECKLKEEFGVPSDRPLTVSSSEPWHKVLGVSPRAKKSTAKRAFDKLHKKYAHAAKLSTEAGQILEVLTKAWKEADRLLQK